MAQNLVLQSIYMKRNKEIYFIYAFKGVLYEETCIGVQELADYLKRPLNSVYTSMSRLRKLKKDLVLKDYNGIKHMILTEKELRTGKWY